jgi:hypothetical protein
LLPVAFRSPRRERGAGVPFRAVAFICAIFGLIRGTRNTNSMAATRIGAVLERV